MSEHTPSPQSVVVPVEPTEAMLRAVSPISGRRVWSAMLAAAPAPSSLAGGEVEKACAVFQEAIDYFEADVADALAEDSERADLWDREVTVNIDALKTVMRAALTPRHEAPASEGEV